METVTRESESGSAPGRQDGPLRPRSGEGANSAMEQLIRQQQSRDAQLPREPAALPAPPSPE